MAKPLQGTDFCGKHTGLHKLRHGRYDNPIDHVVQIMFDKEANKKKRHTNERWYSRIWMWYQARELDLDGVAAMTDEEFDTA